MEPVSGGGLPSPESPGFLSEQLHRRAPRDTEGASAEAHRLTSSFSGGCRRPARPPDPRCRPKASLARACQALRQLTFGRRV